MDCNLDSQARREGPLQSGPERFSAARGSSPFVQATLGVETGTERAERSGRSYYNEHDAHAAAWLRALIAEGLIAPGDVDERSITEIDANDLDGYTQCHFFAGIGGWSLGLRMAGWPDDEPVWTGSCPCQPFSVGNVWEGGGRGREDERHLWPVFGRLIGERAPATVFGEQVANAIGKGWWDEAASDLEGYGYACGAVVLPACGYGAEHERKRLFWVANASGARRERHQPVECVSVAARKALPEYGNPLAGARRALAGDFSGLLPCDGLSVVLERDALKGYGNAIVPQVAAEFIKASREALILGGGGAKRCGEHAPTREKETNAPHELPERE